jgi:hypothetical protein
LLELKLCLKEHHILINQYLEGTPAQDKKTKAVLMGN